MGYRGTDIESAYKNPNNRLFRRRILQYIIGFGSLAVMPAAWRRGHAGAPARRLSFQHTHGEDRLVVSYRVGDTYISGALREIDVRLTDVNTAALRDAALSLARGGVGYYQHPDFVHLDTGRVAPLVIRAIRS